MLSNFSLHRLKAGGTNGGSNSSGAAVSSSSRQQQAPQQAPAPPPASLKTATAPRGPRMSLDNHNAILSVQSNPDLIPVPAPITVTLPRRRPSPSTPKNSLRSSFNSLSPSARNPYAHASDPAYPPVSNAGSLTPTRSAPAVVLHPSLPSPKLPTTATSYINGYYPMSATEPRQHAMRHAHVTGGPVRIDPPAAVSPPRPSVARPPMLSTAGSPARVIVGGSGGGGGNASGCRPVVLITGCTRGGIGHSLSLAMARKGCRVFSTLRDPARLHDLLHILPPPDDGVLAGSSTSTLGTIETLPMDVSDGESVRRAVAAVLGRAGRIDVLVNSAGVALSGGVAEVGIEATRALFETNVLGTLSVIQEVVPHMVGRRCGKVVNMGSMVGYVSFPWSGAYCASKSALRSLTSSLRMELIPFGVQVSLVCAGSVKTNLMNNMNKLIETHPPRNRGQRRLYGPLMDRRSALGLGGGGASASGTDVDSFAEQLAVEILKPRVSGAIMLGKWWWVILIFLQFPEVFIEWILAWRYGLLNKSKWVDAAGGAAHGGGEDAEGRDMRL
ncbi:hypothetical protein HK101_007080 [Irineochytrium annulatum]|nr:hypothetical protein HK101_007080 [Irineochytrium annulatum]